MLESVEGYDVKYHQFFNISEWIVTILFSIEYFLRIICVKKPSKYVFSFYGIVDLLSTIPKYLLISTVKIFLSPQISKAPSKTPAKNTILNWFKNIACKTNIKYLAKTDELSGNIKGLFSETNQ